jgi:hypothetical protein
METLGDWIDVAPWKSAHVLIVDGESRAEHTVGGKRDLLEAWLEEERPDPVLVAWGGQWKTTARIFGPGDVPKVLERLG